MKLAKQLQHSGIKTMPRVLSCLEFLCFGFGVFLCFLFKNEFCVLELSYFGKHILCSICFKHVLVQPNALVIPLFCLLCSVHVLISHLRLTTGWVMVSGVLALALVNAQDCLHVV